MSKNEADNNESDMKDVPQPEDLNRRQFVKKSAAALVLLPYIVPAIQSLTVNTAWAGGKGSPPPRNGSSKPSPPSSPRSYRSQRSSHSSHRSRSGRRRRNRD